MSRYDQQWKVGDKVTAPGGWDGASRPIVRSGVVVELYGPDNWPRVRFEDRLFGDLETCNPGSLTARVEE